MFEVTEATVNLLRLRWKHGVVVQDGGVSHVAGAQPFLKAWVRTAKVKRKFRPVDDDQVYAHIPNLVGGRVIWQGRLTGHNSYRELPNLVEVELATDFSQNGVTQATIHMDNMLQKERTGVAGIYHTFERGYFSPWRGYKPKGRSQAAGVKNEWFDMLNDKSTEIVIVAGYGEDCAIPIFKGLVNDFDESANPDEIEIVARDMGQYLTDQNVFINAKPRNMRDPITFADRRRADDTEDVQGGVEASSAESSHPASNCVDGNGNTFWLSDGHTDKNGHEQMTMKLPAGRYESINLNPQHPGQEVYIAIRARDKNAPGGNGAKRRYVEDLADNEWVDEGLGNIPGTSIPYVKHVKQLKGKLQEYWFPDYGYVLGDDSEVAVFFRTLAPVYRKGDHKREYRASLQEFTAIKRRLPQDQRKEKWILVDDIADIVRTVLQWCGLDVEWEIEDTGVRLKDKRVFNRQDHLMDIISWVAEQVNYVFYMKPPSMFDDDDLTKSNPNHESMGIPVFRMNQAMRRVRETLEPVEEVREDDLLENIEPHFTDEPLAYNIRVRGKRVSKKKGGRFLGGDKTPRYMYVYTPPWSRGDGFPGGAIPGDFRNGNVKRYAVQHDEMLESNQECEVEALFIAFREALESAKGTLEFPAMPTVHLDHQVAVLDTATGLSTRVWITNRTMNIRTGENASMKMGVGGSLIDLPDIVTVRDELRQSLAKIGYNPGLSQWELDHYGDTDDPGIKLHGPPIFTDEGPDYYEFAFEHNEPFAKNPPYKTNLSSPNEAAFRDWVDDESIPFDPDENPTDYDMRGYWQEVGSINYTPGDHFPDKYKTPYDTSFSNESKYATDDCPFKWKGPILVDTRDGQIVFQEMG